LSWNLDVNENVKKILEYVIQKNGIHNLNGFIKNGKIYTQVFGLKD
jgi:hypothetical protein